MEHWDAVFARAGCCGFITTTWVNDLEGSVRRILDFCELPFEAGPCLEFPPAPSAASATASSEQGAPAYFIAKGSISGRTTSCGLGSLKDALGDALERLPALAQPARVLSLMAAIPEEGLVCGRHWPIDDVFKPSLCPGKEIL